MGRIAKWFGADYREAWAKLAAELDARPRKASWTSGLRIDVDVGEWTFTLDTYVVMVNNVAHHYTRLRAPFVNPRGFRFKLSREGFFTKIGKAFGMQDVQIGVPEFDEKWIVQGTDEARLRTIFQTPEIRAALAAVGDVAFAVKDDEGWFGKKFPKGVDELALATGGIVSDPARLKSFFRLFAVTLDRLVETGDASRADPGVTL